MPLDELRHRRRPQAQPVTVDCLPPTVIADVIHHDDVAIDSDRDEHEASVMYSLTGSPPHLGRVKINETRGNIMRSGLAFWALSRALFGDVFDER